MTRQFTSARGRLPFFSLVTSLLVSACSPPVPTDKTSTILPDPESAGAILATKKCAGCHAVPQPNSRFSDEWAAIVHRMQSRRIAKGFGAMSEPEIIRITDYFQSHGKSRI